MGRALAIPGLILLLLMQMGSPFLCVALAKNQAGMVSAESCCAPRRATPFQTPNGMPEGQCCFKTGPLLSKAMVPDHVDFVPDVPVVALAEVMLLIPQSSRNQSALLALPDGSPPTQPFLQVFLI